MKDINTELEKIIFEQEKLLSDLRLTRLFIDIVSLDNFNKRQQMIYDFIEEQINEKIDLITKLKHIGLELMK